MAGSTRLDVKRLLAAIRKADPTKKTNQQIADVIDSIVKAINISGGGANSLSDASFSYDVEGNLIRVDYANGSYKKFTYSAEGDLLSVTDGSTTKNFSYDAEGNLSEVELS